MVHSPEDGRSRDASPTVHRTRELSRQDRVFQHVKNITATVSLALASFLQASGVGPVHPSVDTVSVVVAGSIPKPKEVTHEVEEHVDQVEINHLFDDYGRWVLDQVIFFNWSTAESRLQVHDWRLIKNPRQIPLPEASGGFVARWHDGPVLRKVYAKKMIETYSTYDPELAERENLEKEKRRKLRNKPTLHWAQPPDRANATSKEPISSDSIVIRPLNFHYTFSCAA